MSEAPKISKKKKLIADGVFKAEVHEFFEKALLHAGYAGLTIMNNLNKIKIIVKVVNKQDALGKDGIKGNELELFVEKRFGFNAGRIEIIFETVKEKSQCASAQVEYLKAKLLQGAPARSASQFILRSVCRRENVKGCEVVISGKLRQQRAKTMKYKMGYLVSTGQPKNDFLDVAVRHVFFKQGIIGIKVKIMLPTDVNSIRYGPPKTLPDKITFIEPAKKTEKKADDKKNAGDRIVSEAAPKPPLPTTA